MSIDWDVVTKIAGPVIGLVVGILGKHLFEAKPDVVAFLQHATGVHLPNATPPAAVGTHSVVLANNGKKAATNVRLGHNVLPEFSIVPGIEYAVAALPNGQREIRIPFLIPGKQITISYVYLAPLEWHNVNTHLEHDGGPVRVLRVLPTVPAPTWLRRTLLTLAGAGLIALCYLGVIAIRWGLGSA